MKKILFSALVLGLIGVAPVDAQMTKEQQKQRNEYVKQQRKELNKKESKDAKKQAKEFKKQGWQVTPGSLTLEKQFDRSMLVQNEVDANWYPVYVWGEAMSIGETYDAAKLQATELATFNLATQIQSEIVGMVENSVANKQLGADEAASVTTTVAETTKMISQSLGRVIPLVEAYRVLDNKNKEVYIRVAYNHNNAMEAAKKVVREELEKKGEELREKLDKAMGW